MKPRILIVASHYLPGYKAGGPIRTIANLVACLGHEFDFYILTSDRDLGDTQPYDVIEYGEWMQVGQAKVRYLAPEEQRLSGLAGVLHQLDYEVLYLNSFFSTLSVKIMLLRRTGRIPRTPVILAPRGEFYSGALALKRFKKRFYLVFAKILRVYEDVLWQASTESEVATIRREFGDAECLIAPNLITGPSSAPDRSRHRDAFQVIFLSRIARKKNLDYALRLLAALETNVQFDIYGPLEDAAYWNECQALIGALPSNIHAEYKGVVHPEQIVETFSRYHLFLFPTRGENFGHAIWEALSAGCPVLTSDQTPWHDLEDYGAGWAIPLDAPERFVAVLNAVAAMDEAQYHEHVQAARSYAERAARDENALEANRRLFYSALEQ